MSTAPCPQPAILFRPKSRLRDGRSIHTVTALILQLVQTSAHDTALQAREFSKKRRELAVQSSGASRKIQDQSMVDLDHEVSSSWVPDSPVSRVPCNPGDEALYLYIGWSIQYRPDYFRFPNFPVRVCAGIHDFLLNISVVALGKAKALKRPTKQSTVRFWTRYCPICSPSCIGRSGLPQLFCSLLPASC